MRPVRLDVKVIDIAVRPALRIASFSGATELPSPVISVVMPWKILEGKMRIHQNRELGLPEHIDEPRRHHHAVRVDGLLCRGLGELPNGRDSSISNSHVSGIPRRSRAVDDVAIANYHIKSLRPHTPAECQK